MYDGTPLAPFADLLEREFPREGEGIFLNSAAQGLLPRRAIRAMAAFEAARAYPSRIDDARLREVEETCRARLAQLIGAPPERVGLAVNTSEGLNLAALQIPLTPGDRVLLQRSDFPANVVPWLARAQGGVEIDFLETPPDAHLDAGDVAAALDRDRRIRVVALPLVHFATGHRHPIEDVGEACRARGAWLVVDATQGLGVVPFDAEAAGADLVACGGQKWLCAPWGSGFYVVSERLLATAPARAGWLQLSRAQLGPGEYAALTGVAWSLPADASRFEVGTYAYTALLGLSESAALFLEVSIARIDAHARALLDRVARFLEERGAEVVSCFRERCRSGILAFRLEDGPATRALHTRLVAAGVTCGFREGAIRLAIHLYTTPADIDRALDRIEAAWPVPQRVATP